MRAQRKILAAFTACVCCLNFTAALAAGGAKKGERIFELDMSGQSVGSVVTGGMKLSGEPETNFVVTEVDAAVSESGKAVSCDTSAGTAETYEIYFDAEKPITFDISEGTHYFIKYKARVPRRNGAFRSDLQSKISLFNKELAPNGTSGRAYLSGFENRGGETLGYKIANGVYTPDALSGETWYNILYDVYAAENPAENMIYASVYPIGEAAPDTWQISSNAAYDGVDSTWGYKTAVDADFIGVKAYNSLIDFTDYSIYAYTDSEVEEFNALKESINSLNDGIGSGLYTLSSAEAELNAINASIASFNGILAELASEGIAETENTINENKTVIDNAAAFTEELRGAEITTSNVLEYYKRAEECRALLENVSFAAERDEMLAELAAAEEEKIMSVLTQFNVYDDFTQEDGAVSPEGTGEGWNGGWSASPGDANIISGELVLTGGCEASRQMTVPVRLDDAFDYYISWDMSLNGAVRAGIKINETAAGARTEADGTLIFAGDSVSEESIKEGGNTYIMRLSKTDEGCGVAVKTSDITPLEYAVKSSADVIDGADKITLFAEGGGAAFDNISVRMIPQAYTSAAENYIKEWQSLEFNEEADFEKAAELEKNALSEIEMLPDGAVKRDFENAVSAEREKTNDKYDELLSSKADEVIAELEAKLSGEKIGELKEYAGKMSDEELKKKYEAAAAEYEKEFNELVPVVTSVGIEGNIVKNASVRAKVSVSNPYNVEYTLKYEWLLGGSRISSTESAVLNGTGSLVLRVTPVNANGAEGETKESPRATVGSSGGSVSSGGGGGGGSYIPRPVQTPVPGEDDDSNIGNGNVETPEISVFEDIAGHWAKDSITNMYNKGVVSGVSDTRFEPDRNITRAEFVKLLVTAFGLESGSVFGGFDDVSGGDWFAEYVNTAGALGIVNGFDGNFRPNDNITREEAVKILMEGRRISLNPEEEFTKTEAGFNDNDKISGWAVPYAAEAAALGIVAGDEYGNFNPKSQATRAEAVVMLERAMAKNVD